MTHSRRGAGDLTRAIVTAAEVLAITAGAHALAGGALPSVSWFAVMAGAVFAATLFVLRGRIRIRTAVSFVAVGQVLLHLTFELGTAAEHAGHAAHGPAEPAIGLPMVFAHLVTTIATAVLLLLQDRAVRLAGDWLDAWTGYQPFSQLPRPKLSPTSDRVPFSVRRELLLRSPRRGPPTPILLRS